MGDHMTTPRACSQTVAAAGRGFQTQLDPHLGVPRKIQDAPFTLNQMDRECFGGVSAVPCPIWDAVFQPLTRVRLFATP